MESSDAQLCLEGLFTNLTIASSKMIVVKPVTDWLQFESCLQLRFETYSRLGYVDSSNQSDLDPFDWSSIHFIALDEHQTIAGTVRLIIAERDVDSVIPELESSQTWYSRFEELNGNCIRKSTSIPILETMKGNHITESILRAERPAELSRIIVAPDFRSKGVSRLLSDAVVDQAKRLRRDVLFLQCLPGHVGLFQKLGFDELLPSLDYRLLTVPDRVVAMRMILEENLTVGTKDL